MGKRQRKRERLAAKKPEPVEDIAEKITEDLVTEVIKVPSVEQEKKREADLNAQLKVDKQQETRLPKRPWWKFWRRRETTAP